MRKYHTAEGDRAAHSLVVLIWGPASFGRVCLLCRFGCLDAGEACSLGLGLEGDGDSLCDLAAYQLLTHGGLFED